MKAMKTFLVEGRGRFPDDMLRYDVCEFASEADEEMAYKGAPMIRRVTLRFLPGPGRKTTTNARWASFGWYVVQE